MKNEAGHPVLSSHPSLNALTAACIYYDLNVESLFHLFVPGYQDPVFKGQSLGHNSTPIDLAKNIQEYVDLLKEDSNGLWIEKKEQKVIKKYKYKNVA